MLIKRMVMKKILVIFVAFTMSLSSCSIFVSSKHHRAGVEVGSNDTQKKNSKDVNAKPAEGTVKQ
jgi:hypothetical protein